MAAPLRLLDLPDDLLLSTIANLEFAERCAAAAAHRRRRCRRGEPPASPGQALPQRTGATGAVTSAHGADPPG